MPFSWASLQTASPSCSIFVFNRACTCSMGQESPCRFCTHSKYETVTPPRICQDVRENDDVLGVEDFISFGGYRRVGEFEDDVSLYACGISCVNHVLQGGQNEQLAVDRNKLVGRKRADSV